MPAWIVMILIDIAISTVMYLLTPKPPTTEDTPAELQPPTAAEGVVMIKGFGTFLVTPNVLWWGEKSTKESEIDA